MKIKLALGAVIIALLVNIAIEMRFKPGFLARVLSPAAGLQSSLPEHVYEALPLLYKHGADRYYLSGKIFKSNSSLYQRFVESTYPMRVWSGASIIVGFADEQMDDCKLLERGQHVVIYDCAK